MSKEEKKRVWELARNLQQEKIEEAKKTNAETTSAHRKSERAAKRSRHAVDYDQKSENEWGKADEQARTMVDSGRSGYETWEASLSQIVALGLHLNRAVHYGVDPSKVASNVASYVISKVVGKEAGPALLASLGAVPDAVRDYLESKVAKDPKVVLPKLDVLFTVNPADSSVHLEDSFMRDDTKEALQGEHKDTMRLAIQCWLREQNCHVNQDGKVLALDTHPSKVRDEALKKEEIEAMRDDPDNGLSAFFKKCCDLEVTSRLSP